MSELIKSLHITYKDGSNPFCVIAVKESIINEHIEWQKKHNGDNIKSIYVTDGTPVKD